MTYQKTIWGDTLKSVSVWRVWCFLGMQDVKGRFRRSLIGPLWILINLALMVAGAGVVYGLLFSQPMADFLPFLTAGLVIWGFIVSTVTEGGYAFVGAEGYIKQFTYPKQTYLLRALVSHAVILSIGIAVVVGVLLLFSKPIIIGVLLAVPGVMMLLVAGLAHVWISAYLTTRFRDLPHAVGGILQVLFFVTPIMFPVSVLRERHLDFVYQWNPLHYLIDVVRHPLLTGELALPESYLFGGIYVMSAWAVAAIVAKKLDARIVFLL